MDADVKTDFYIEIVTCDNLFFFLLDKKNGILEMFRSSGQKEWCLFLAVSSNFKQAYYFCFVK